MDALWLVEEILARLPLREVFRLKCVCKSWRDVISDPAFVQKQQAFNPIPATYLVTYSASLQGTMLLNPLSNQASWIRAPGFDCPTNPAGKLVAASGGLLCYVITRWNEDGKVAELDFVIWNPVTNIYMQLPTLYPEPGFAHERPVSTMVVRQGRLHQLWVCVYFAACVFDCFISKETMQARIANRGNLMKPLPNSWIEFWINPYPRTLIFHDSKLHFACGCGINIVDVDNFEQGDIYFDGESIDAPCDVFVWDGKVVGGVSRPLVQEYKICTINIYPQGDKAMYSLKPFLRFEVKDHMFDTLLVGGNLKMLYMLNYDYDTKDLLVHLSGNGEDGFLVESMQEVRNPIPYRQPQVLQLSLTDSPGTPCNVCFDWNTVEFPEENSLLDWSIL